MIGVDEAIQRIRAAFSPIGSERVGLSDASGRVLAVDAIANLDQPPAAVSAMDGYAVRLDDAPEAGRTLRVIGTAPAGHPFLGTVDRGEAVRIFTGGVVPEGANAILIQENAEVRGADIVTLAPATAKHIRPRGLDFHLGATLLPAGRALTPRDISLIAAGDLAEVIVRRRPRVAVAATGDELSRPGEPRSPGGIVASSLYGLCALIEKWGGEPLDLGILRDTAEAIGASRSGGCLRAESWNRLPIVRMTNVSILPGSEPLTLEELIASTERGVLMETNRSWSIDDKRYNFQFGCEIGWEIVGGKRTRMLKNPSYSGITTEFWNSMDAICSRDAWTLWGIPNCGKGQPQQVMGTGHGAAPARFRGVAVGTAYKGSG